MKKWVAVLMTVLMLFGVFTVGVGAEGIQMVDVTLTASFTGSGNVVVKATDGNGSPVAAYKLSLTVDGMLETGNRVKTDANGTYTSTYRVGEGKKASFEGLETVYDETLTYAATAKQVITRQSVVTTAGETTTTVSETTTTVSGETTTTTATETTSQAAATTTTVATTAQATTGTTAIVKGDSTTALEDDMILTSAITDTALLDAFGLKRQEFLSKARLLLTETDYQALVGRTGNVPMLSVRSSAVNVSAEQVQSAVGKVSAFSVYDETQRKMQTFDLSLVMTTRYGEEVALTVLPDGVFYTVRLPIPASMAHCATYAVTMVDGGELITPHTVEVKNGMFEIKTNALATYTLIGFGDESDNKAGGTSLILVAFLVAGIVLIAGGGVILYLFVLRKPAPQAVAKAVAQTADVVESDTDIFSGRTDIDGTSESDES